jgi:hypothetical protein
MCRRPWHTRWPVLGKNRNAEGCVAFLAVHLAIADLFEVTCFGLHRLHQLLCQADPHPKSPSGACSKAS